MTFNVARLTVALISLLTSHQLLADGPVSSGLPPGKAQTIYRCRIDGVSTFSDHPCGERIEQYDGGLGRLSILDSPPVAVTTVARTPKRVPASHDITDDTAQTAKAGACQRSQQSLRRIKAQMRAGYSAKQGDRLRAQQKNLEERRRTLEC